MRPRSADVDKVIRRRATDALFGLGLDARVRAARLAAVLYLLGGTTALVSSSFLPSYVNLPALYAIAALAYVTAGLIVLLPWQRFPAWSIALPLVWGVTLITLIGAWAGALSHFALFYGLASLYVGLTLPTKSWRWVTPLYATSVAVAILGAEQATATVDLLGAIGLAAIVGEVLSGAIGRARQAMRGTQGLLTGVTALHAAESEEAAAAQVADLAHRLLSPGGTLLLVATHPGSRLFTNRGQAGSDFPLGSLVVDTQARSGVREAISTGTSIFVADGLRSPLLARIAVARFGFTSLVFVPVPGEGSYLGCLVIGWTEPKAELEPYEEQVLALLSEQAGRLLERLRRVGALAVEARTDSLTGLANRRAFLECLDRLRPGGAVVFFDLDHFKHLNDTQGHQAGDAALAGFAVALRSCIREGDCAARYGGEEFALVLPSVGGIDLTAIAEATVARIRDCWAGPVTFSVGIAIHRTGDAPSTTLARADAAVYEAKAAGRNTLIVA
ncbi:MAG: sensor domain-containing diguanylate cyclase [Mycobacteriales bacterium]